MGTNYYIVCKYCEKTLHHIGKQSAGHNFKSNISKDDFRKLKLKENEEIRDEYGRPMSKRSMMGRVTVVWDEPYEGRERGWEEPENSWS